MSFYEDFALTESRLQSVLETAIGKYIARFTLVAADEIKAGATDADKRICTFRCVTTRGAESDVRVFVKRCVWQNVRESIHYRYLADHGVPTARLFGAVTNDLGQEIVFLEVVATTRFDDENLGRWRSMLTLLARFSACPIEPDYVRELHPYSLIGQIAQRLWLSGYPARLEEEEITPILRQQGISETELSALLAAARVVFVEANAQPHGLLHQDFNSGNFGWRNADSDPNSTSAAIVFDLHKNGRGPRFSDVAPYLSKFEWSDRTAAFLNRIVSEEQGSTTLRNVLTDHYLTEYARFGGPIVSRETFETEVDTLCFAHKITALPMLLERGDTDSVARVIGYLRQLAARNAVRNR